MAFLETRNVSKRFGSFTAVNDVSFEIGEGEVFGIAGPNGAGKTTLFNLISGMYAFQGDIFFSSRRISGLKPHRICAEGIARTFQIPALFSSLTVFENLQIAEHFGNNQGKTNAFTIRGVLKLIGLEGREETAAHRLPLYEKKLTMLGAALATNPRLLLLDEPAGGLSPIEIRKSVGLFRTLNEKYGVTIIIIEHLMKVLIEISDRLMILHNGARIALGPPGEVAKDRKVIEVYLGEEYARRL